MVDIYELLPRERTPVDYRNLVSDPRIDQEGLRQLGQNPFSFVRSAVAWSPLADAATLAAVSLDGLDRWTRYSILIAIARHPNADRSTLLGVLRVTRTLLNKPNGRPFAAALALASRRELSEAEVLDLLVQPNASRRMARGVRRALSERKAGQLKRPCLTPALSRNASRSSECGIRIGGVTSLIAASP